MEGDGSLDEGALCLVSRHLVGGRGTVRLRQDRSEEERRRGLSTTMGRRSLERNVISAKSPVAGG